MRVHVTGTITEASSREPIRSANVTLWYGGGFGAGEGYRRTSTDEFGEYTLKYRVDGCPLFGGLYLTARRDGYESRTSQVACTTEKQRIDFALD